MINPKNMLVLSGGLVDVPEEKNNLITLRLAVDFSGSEQGSDNKSGYFTVKYWTNNEDSNTKFVKKQIADGNFKKGSQLTVAGRILQERWSTDANEKRQTVTVIAEAITYSGGGAPRSAEQATATEATGGDATAVNSAPNTF